MSIFFRAKKKKYKKNGVFEEKYFAVAKTKGTLGIDELAKEISLTSIAKESTIIPVLMELSNILGVKLVEGYNIKFKGIGTFGVSITSQGCDNEDDLKPKMVEFSKLTYRADSKLIKMLKKVRFEKEPPAPKGFISKEEQRKIKAGANNTKKIICFILLFLNIGLGLWAQNTEKMKLDSVGANGIAYHSFGYDQRGNMIYYYSTMDTNIYTYDDNNNILSDTYIGMAMDSRYEYTYDENSNVLSTTRLNNYTGQWVGETKTENTYNERNQLVDQVYYKNQGQWQALSKSTCYYNPSDYLIKIRRSNFSNSGWVDGINSSYIYDSNNNHILTVDSSSSGPSSKTEYTYDQRNNNLSRIDYNRSIEGWIYNRKTEYTYDENNNTLSTIVFMYYESDWMEITRTENTYDANNNCTSITKPTRRQEWTFDTNGNCLTETYSTKEQGETDWTYTARHSYTYDENNNKTLDILTQYYDDIWNNNMKSEYIYDYSFSNEDLILPKDYFKMNNMLTTVKSSTWGIYNWSSPYSSYYYYSKHNTISIDKIPINNIIKVYPNPAQDYISFSLPGNELYTVKLYNSNGASVLETRIRGNNRIDISILTKGLYFYKISGKAEEIISGKIIKL